jgi:hypothetical protein
VSTNTMDRLAPAAQGAAPSSAASGLMTIALLEQRVRELEVAHAELEDRVTRAVDEAFFAAVNASLDSQRTASRTGTRDGEWMEGRHHG